MSVMARDVHTIDRRYEIRSPYFDNLAARVLREKIDCVKYREEFRIRYYNRDASFIVLEKKSKINGLCNKGTIRTIAGRGAGNC